MKPLFFFLCMLVYAGSQAQTETDTTTYLLTLSSGRTSLVKILEVQKGQYIKVLDQHQTLYTFSWDAFKSYKPLYQAQAEVIEGKHEPMAAEAKPAVGYLP